jgi:hypothetical protein
VNTLLATYPKSDSIQALWLTEQPSIVDEMAHEQIGLELPREKTLELSFSRIAIGFSFDPLFITVIGERRFDYNGKHETIYIPLAESLDTDNITQTLDDLISLKDTYRASIIFVSSSPASMLESVRKLEGLTHYTEPKLEHLAQRQFPSFVDFDLTSSIAPIDIPDENTISADLNDMLSTPAIDPKSGLDLMGADMQAIPRLMFLDDFPTFRTIQTVRANAPGAQAIWLATHGLNRSVKKALSIEDERFQRDIDRQPRVRNPTGY